MFVKQSKVQRCGFKVVDVTQASSTRLKGPRGANAATDLPGRPLGAHVTCTQTLVALDGMLVSNKDRFGTHMPNFDAFNCSVSRTPSWRYRDRYH